jgi:hypothetical protein
MRSLSLLPLIVLLAGCGSGTQITSGAEYLAARPEYGTMSATSLDKAVERAANVEPLLRFPAKLGLARISGGRFVAVPPQEADAWIAFAQSHGQYGELVPISPIIGDLAIAGTDYEKSNGYGGNAIIPIRLAAARQHVDAVLVYAVGGASKDRHSVLSVVDLTIVGAFLVPSRFVEGTALASGLLFDVRNGYPYGTVTATSSQTGFVANHGSGERAQDLQVDAQTDAVTKLTVEADKMLRKLTEDMQERDRKAAETKAAGPAKPADTVVPPPRKG